MSRYSKNHQTQHRQKPKRWDGNIQKLLPLGHGVSGMVLAIDADWVAKIDIGSDRSIDDIDTERKIYERFIKRGESEHVLRCREVENPNGLVLERCKDTVRGRLRTEYRNQAPPEELARRWAYEAAQALAYIHRCGVVQGDVGCHNMLLTQTNKLKFGDFAGSSLDNSTATVDYEDRSKLPNSNITNEASDMFALGSAIYEIATGSAPYADLSWREVHGLYKRGKFPKLQGTNGLETIIKNCWKRNYASAQDIVYDLEVHFPLFARINSYDSGYVGSAETLKDSTWEREPASKYQYVKQASVTRPGSSNKDFDSQKRNSKRGRRRERERRESTGPLSGFFSFFKGQSYTYAVER